MVLITLEPIDSSRILEKEVGKSGTGGVVYLPKSWIGKKVTIIK